MTCEKLVLLIHRSSFPELLEEEEEEEEYPVQYT